MPTAPSRGLRQIRLFPVAAKELIDHLLAVRAMDPALRVLLRCELQGDAMRLHAIGRRHQNFEGACKSRVFWMPRHSASRPKAVSFIMPPQ